MLMRGKSTTCRIARVYYLRVSDPPGGLRPDKLSEDLNGKTETYRASAWQSHIRSTS